MQSKIILNYIEDNSICDRQVLGSFDLSNPAESTKAINSVSSACDAFLKEEFANRKFNWITSPDRLSKDRMFWPRFEIDVVEVCK